MLPEPELSVNRSSVWRSLPENLQRELHLARGRGSAGDGPGGSRNTRWSEDDEVGGVEIGAIQEIEDFGAEL